MHEPLKAYRGTKTNWSVTQGQINALLHKHEIYDIQYTTISYHTGKDMGIEMNEGSFAIVLVFQKHVTLPDGRGGNIPVRIVIPNITDTTLNQHYRLLYWFLKSKFESIDAGLVEFAEEFMAHLQIADKSGIGRLWDRFKKGFYKRLGDNDMPDANLLPPQFREDDDD